MHWPLHPRAAHWKSPLVPSGPHCPHAQPGLHSVRFKWSFSHMWEKPALSVQSSIMRQAQLMGPSLDGSIGFVTSVFYCKLMFIPSKSVGRIPARKSLGWVYTGMYLVNAPLWLPGLEASYGHRKEQHPRKWLQHTGPRKRVKDVK